MKEVLLFVWTLVSYWGFLVLLKLCKWLWYNRWNVNDEKNQNCTQSYQKHLSAALALLPLLRPAHPTTFVKSGPAHWDQDLSQKEYRQKMETVWNGME